MAVGILLSGGSGSRAGFDIPKQYMTVKDKMIITYCTDTLEECCDIDSYIIVASNQWREKIREAIGNSRKFMGFANPGENRQLSIFNGLKMLEDEVEADTLVMIHDAARPLLTSENISDYVKAAVGHDGVLPVLPMKDTIYYSETGNSVTGLLDRSKLYAGQAPEFFNMEKYIDANESILSQIMMINGSTEPAIMAQMDIAMVAGNEENFKVTTKADFERFQDIVLKRG